MKYLLDTCVISELAKPKPDPKVASWITSKEEENFYLSSITIGEIQRGIFKLPASEKKIRLQEWLDIDLINRFSGRILGIGLDESKKWGEIQAIAEKSGKKMPLFDSLIAAASLVHGMTVVTRNEDDMKASGVSIVNPWGTIIGNGK